jgi:site-specific DNA-methyltransferase (adenine-specific)
MTEPYWRDGDNMLLFHGDSLEVLRAMAEASIDAVVCDPPYGLEFMGREWDTFGRGEARSNATAGMSAAGYSDGARRIEAPTFLGGVNPRCKSCGHSQRGGSPCRCANPDFTDERGPRLRAFQAWTEDWARECWRVLKPGGHLLAFGGTRTWHRLTCGIEDAGFEIRDTITWMYGSGFPKSLDVSKAIDKAAGATREVVDTKLGQPGYANTATTGRMLPTMTNGAANGYLDVTAPATDAAKRWAGWGTALKPASEPIVVARKPLAGTVAGNVQAYGTGALNIDGCRVGNTGGTRDPGFDSHAPESVSAYGHGLNGRSSVPVAGLGRWPSNVVLSHAATPDGEDLCADRCVPGCPIAELDAQSGYIEGGIRPARRSGIGFGEGAAGTNDGIAIKYDSGGASRFFPTFRYEAKAPASERPRIGRGASAGVTGNRCALCGWTDVSGSPCVCPEPQWIARDGSEGVVAHPTVKPVDLMRWLVKLVTPPGGMVLDPFAGSGTTGEACIVEGFRVTLIELDPGHLPLIVKRLSKGIQPVLEF